MDHRRDQAGLRATDLRAKLARWHADVDNAFYGWNGAWLDPEFRAWDISDLLAYIRVPVQIVQGEADQYGTLRQVEIAQRVHCPVEIALHSRRRPFAAARSAGRDAGGGRRFRQPHPRPGEAADSAA